MTSRKPHSGNAGYVCELRCKLGGHIVIYDRQNGADYIDADDRWIVMHEPSSLHVSVRSLAHARDIMKGVARAETRHDACLYADILPHDTDDGGAEMKAREEKLSAPDRKAALDRFMADEENHPTEEGKAALRVAFGLGGKS